MAWFLCNYKPWPNQYPDLRSPIGSYSSFIWARDLGHAKKLARARRIGERVLWERGNRGKPFTPPSVQLRCRQSSERQRLDVIHATTFLAFLFLRSGKAVAHTAVGDEGFLHLLLHHYVSGWPRKRRMIAILEIYERAVPGYWPKAKRKR